MQKKLERLNNDLDKFFKYKEKTMKELEEKRDRVRNRLIFLENEVTRINDILSSPDYSFNFKCKSVKYLYDIKKEVITIRDMYYNVVFVTSDRILSDLEKILQSYGINIEDLTSYNVYRSDDWSSPNFRDKVDDFRLKSSIHNKLNKIKFSIYTKKIDTISENYLDVIEYRVNVMKNRIETTLREKPDYNFLTKKFSYTFELAMLIVLVAITSIFLGNFSFFATNLGIIVLVISAVMINIKQEKMAIYLKFMTVRTKNWLKNLKK